MVKIKKKKSKAPAKKQKQITNLDFLHQCANGDRARVKEYITLYLKSVPELLRKLKESIEKTDWQVIRTSAHSLKSLSTYAGIDSIKEKLLAIEKNAIAKTNFKAITADLKLVESVFKGSFAELNQFLEKK